MSKKNKKLPGKIIFRIIAAGTVLFAGSSAAEGRLDTGFQDVMEKKIQGTIETKYLEMATAENLQKKMMEEGKLVNLLQEKIQPVMLDSMRTAIKSNTASRKRLNPVEVCMQCRVKPIKVTISNQSTLLDSETQALINQKMAAMVKGTIQKKSSDPDVVRIVQERVMGERMQENILQQDMQPMVMDIMRTSVMKDTVSEKTFKTDAMPSS